jgi:hypothetical protein
MQPPKFSRQQIRDAYTLRLRQNISMHNAGMPELVLDQVTSMFAETFNLSVSDAEQMARLCFDIDRAMQIPFPRLRRTEESD